MNRHCWDPHWPLSPAKSPVFYGWVIALFAGIGTICSIPGQTAGVGAFKEYLTETLQLSSVQLSNAYMAGTVAAGLMLPLAGKLVDRYGIRISSVLTYALFGSALIFMSLTAEIYERLKGIISPHIAAIFLISLGYFLIRFLGQGMIALMSRTMLAKWFNRRRGRVIAISGVFVTVIFSSSPYFIYKGIQSYGAPTIWLLIGSGIFLAMTVLAFLFHRDNPEECGLHPDGIHPDDLANYPDSKSFITHKHFVHKEAIATSAFWLYTLATGLNGLVITSLVFHSTDISIAYGMEPESFMKLLIPASFASMAMGFLFGWLADKADLKWVLFIMMLGLSLSLVGMLNLSEIYGRLFFVIGNGSSWAGFGILFTGAAPRFFGTKHLASINGWVASVTVIMSAIGPSLFSYTEKNNGSYTLAIQFFIFLPLLFAAFSHFVRNPQLKYAP